MGDESKQVEGLLAIQHDLQVAKSRWNNFGKYHYFNAEDILNALKPLLYKHKLQLTIATKLISLNDSVYVEATVTVTDARGNSAITTTYAREPLAVSGMSPFQITGAATTYATKYGLGLMFLIEDSEGIVDPDSFDNSMGDQVATPKLAKPPMPKHVHTDEPSDDDGEEEVSPYCTTPGCKNSKKYASKPLGAKVVTFSFNKFGRVLCYECQQALK